MASLGEKQARLAGLVQLEDLDTLEELNEACLRHNLCTGSHDRFGLKVIIVEGSNGVGNIIL